MSNNSTLDMVELKMDFSEFQINRSVYATASEQLEEFIKSEITSKNLSPGYRLPNTSEIVRIVNVGAATVRQAMASLVKAGLIESTPGKGTFVSEKANNRESITSEGENGRSLVSARYGIIGSLAGVSESLWYRQQTITGIVKQCDQFSADVVLLSSILKNKGLDEMYEDVLDAKCDVFVWLYPEPCDWEAIESLQRLGVSLVVTRYSHGNDDLPSVELDTEQAGFEVGAYFVGQGCSRVIALSSNKTDAVSATAMKHGCWPHNIESGLLKAYRYLKPSEKMPVVVENTSSDYAYASEKIYNVLKNVPAGCGLFFGDSMQLFHYIKTYKDSAIRTLEGKVLVSTSNNSALAVFAAIGIDLPIRILTFPYEEIGRIAIQKANNLREGHMNGTATLLRLPFEQYNPDLYIGELVKELNSRTKDI